VQKEVTPNSGKEQESPMARSASSFLKRRCRAGIARGYSGDASFIEGISGINGGTGNTANISCKGEAQGSGIYEKVV